MNRRRLILTTLGALAGAFIAPSVSFVSAAPLVPSSPPEVHMADLFVTESAEVSAAISGLTRVDNRICPTAPRIAIGSLILRDQDEMEAILMTLGDHLAKHGRK